MKAIAIAGCLSAACLAPLLARQPASPQGPPEQSPPPQERTVTIVDPVGDVPIIGSTLFRAALEPPDTPFASVEIFVNDNSVCRLTRPPLECRYDVGPWTSSRTVRALARFPDGKTVVSSELTTPGVDFTEESGVVSVSVPAQVVDRHDKFVANLGRAEFRIYEDGVEQKITDFRTVGVPLEIVVAVDISDSMRDDLPVLKQSVKSFVETVRPMDSLTVIAFNDKLYRLPQPVRKTAVSPATGLMETVGLDKGTLLEAIDKLTCRSGTALYQTIIAAVQSLRERHYAQAVGLITDGDDTVAGVTESMVERMLVASEARLFVVVQGQESTTGRVRELVKKLTQLTGGRAYSIGKIGELQGVLKRIAEDLQNQYYLAYTPANDRQDGTIRTIDVRLAGKKDYRVQARRQYQAGKK